MSIRFIVMQALRVACRSLRFSNLFELATSIGIVLLISIIRSYVEISIKILKKLLLPKFAIISEAFSQLAMRQWQ